jgi:hypothetical protein
MKRQRTAVSCGLALLLVPAFLHTASAAEPAELPDFDDSVEQREPWADGSARTMPVGRAEIGVFSPARWTPVEGVELGLHPVWFFVLPHVEAKLQWASFGAGFYFATQHRLSYPSLFLNLVATEGTGGLLPNDSNVPQALIIDNYALLSRTLGEHQVLTLRAGISVGPRTSSDLPLLDFPFLYAEFAPLYAPLVPRAGALVEGRIAGDFHYSLEFLASFLPVGDEEQGTRDAWAFDEAVELHYRIHDTHEFSAGMLIEQAEYPIGWRVYFLPTVDYRYAW